MRRERSEQDDEGISIFEPEKASSTDVDWDKGELPIALPSGLSEGASLVKLKNGKVAVIQRNKNGYHFGASIFTDDMLKVLKKFLK